MTCGRCGGWEYTVKDADGPHKVCLACGGITYTTNPPPLPLINAQPKKRPATRIKRYKL